MQLLEPELIQLKSIAEVTLINPYAACWKGKLKIRFYHGANKIIPVF